jgi:hypothetical protein
MQVVWRDLSSSVNSAQYNDANQKNPGNNYRAVETWIDEICSGSFAHQNYLFGAVA